MSIIKKNVLSNYVTQIYLVGINVFMIPLYIRYMGTEAYGIIGFFTMLQVWFQLLDLGLTSTLIKQVSQLRGRKLDVNGFHSVLKKLECFFVVIGCLGTGIIVIFSNLIVHKWLKIGVNSFSEMHTCIILMALIVGLRWISSVYRSVINGFEKQVFLNGINIFFATFRFVLVMFVIIYIENSIKAYFIYQLSLAVFELLVFVYFSYTLIPKKTPYVGLKEKSTSFRGIIKFTFSIAFTNMIWILITQTDRLMLSHYLSMNDYAYFIAAVSFAAGINALASPIGMAISPRLAKFAAENNDEKLIKLYRYATRVMCLVIFPIVTLIVIFPKQVLYVWTGNSILSGQVGSILSLYAFANGILAIAAFPFYLQFAKGDLFLHVFGNVLSLMITVPLLVILIPKFGALAAGFILLSMNITYFFLWTPIIHRRFYLGLHRKWFINDIGLIALSLVVGGFVMNSFSVWTNNRVSDAVLLFLYGGILYGIAGIQFFLSSVYFKNKSSYEHNTISLSSFFRKKIKI